MCPEKFKLFAEFIFPVVCLSRLKNFKFKLVWIKSVWATSTKISSGKNLFPIDVIA